MTSEIYIWLLIMIYLSACWMHLEVMCVKFVGGKEYMNLTANSV